MNVHGEHPLPPHTFIAPLPRLHFNDRAVYELVIFLRQINLFSSHSLFLSPLGLFFLFLKSRCTIKNIIKLKDLCDSTLRLSCSCFSKSNDCMRGRVSADCFYSIVCGVRPQRGWEEEEEEEVCSFTLQIKDGGEGGEQPPPYTGRWCICATLCTCAS